MPTPDHTFAASQVVVETVSRRVPDGEEARVSQAVYQGIAKRIPDADTGDLEVRNTQIVIQVLARRYTPPPEEEGLYTLAQNGTFW